MGYLLFVIGITCTSWAINYKPFKKKKKKNDNRIGEKQQPKKQGYKATWWDTYVLPLPKWPKKALLQIM